MRSRLLLLSLVAAVSVTVAPRAAAAQGIVRCCVHYEYDRRYDVEERLARAREQRERALDRAREQRERAADRQIEARMRASDRAFDLRMRAQERAQERARVRDRQRLEAIRNRVFRIRPSRRAW